MPHAPKGGHNPDLTAVLGTGVDRLLNTHGWVVCTSSVDVHSYGYGYG